MICSTYYLDQNLDLSSDDHVNPERYEDYNLADNEDIVYRRWKKDYFTAALPFRQRGTAPALTSEYNYDVFLDSNDNGVYDFGELMSGAGSPDGTVVSPINVVTSPGDESSHAIKVNALGAGLMDISTLRQMVQVQRWLEKNARAGSRYKEFLMAHFGAWPRDERLQRPEYLGGLNLPVIFSEVLQTSSSEDGDDVTKKQANMAGHGITAGDSFAFKYHASEFGIVMGIFSVMPRASYSQGVNRQWLRQSRFDYYFPEFAHLSEQAVYRMEVCANNGTDVTSGNYSTFGYQGIYDEMRYKPDLVCADFRDVFNYWHFGREFYDTDGVTPLPPSLNSDFISAVPNVVGGIRYDVFAVQNEHPLLVTFGNTIRASRPLPQLGEPGFLDHF